jgi:23S rRNA U2552 (ribose-2'-O)-methylase RlmE/FtsJ
MSYYQLPEVHSTIPSISIETNDESNIYISPTLRRYLNKIKQQLDENFENWDYYKKYTNPYEFIHTIIPNTKYSVSKLKPLSRSFYKMIEIINHLELLNNYSSQTINTFHLAEGPGGFIEAITYLRNNELDRYHGMTLIDPCINVPGWKKTSSFLEKHTNVIIETGATGTGDLLNVNNLQYCHDTYKNKMDIITADGGFDFSIDFNQQEVLATKLLFAQVSFAIAMQKQNGHFVLKIFDIFTKATIDIIYWLSTLYKQVYIIKPCTSRLANSEKYIICKYFKGDKHNIINNIISEYSKLNSISHISSILMFDLDYYYINKVEEYNAIFGQQQIENISSTITMFSCKNKNEKIELLKKNFIQKCVQWCEKHNISYNNILTNHNIFLNTP